MLHQTRTEAIAREIVDPIEASGVVADAYAEFDVEAIAGEVISYADGYDYAESVYRVNQAGFYCNTWPDDFWATVAAHTREEAA